MAEFPFHTPSETDTADALEGLEDVLRLDQVGEIDLPAYPIRLLLQLEETLAAVLPSDELELRGTSSAISLERRPGKVIRTSKSVQVPRVTFSDARKA